MKKGFTLIELMIVIIIIGILATIGIVQYQAAVEKSRGAEAKSVLGFLNSQCAAVWMETGATSDCATRINLGAGDTNLPNACRASHWFSYAFTSTGADTANLTATRCTASGKSPNAANANELTLLANYTSGSGQFAAQTNY